MSDHKPERDSSSSSPVSTTTTTTPPLMENDDSFMLFGHPIKLEKKRINVVDDNRVSSVKDGSFFFELIKIDEREKNDTKKDGCERKMIDFMGLSKECKQKNTNCFLRLKAAVQECPKIDPVGRIGSSASKKRSWISTRDDHIHIPCWPTLHKKPRTVRAPNTTTCTTSSALVPLPSVNYAKENHAVQECPVGRIGSKKRSWISTCDDHIPCWPTLHKKQRTVRQPNTTTSTSSALGPLPLVNHAKENHAVNNAVVFPNHQQLVLFGDHEDPWKIKKVLKKSDVNGSSRLLIGTDMVSRHILPHVWRNTNADFDDKKGTEVVIWDMDTGSRHKLTLKRWKSKSFVFVGGWTSDFVKRRNLKENDEIALKWDDSNSMLEFTLLHRNH